MSELSCNFATNISRYSIAHREISVVHGEPPVEHRKQAIAHGERPVVHREPTIMDREQDY